MKYGLIIVLALVSGCETTPAPMFSEGYYFMTGDEDCHTFSDVAPGAIQCFNRQGQATFYRRAMTNEELMFSRQSQYREKDNISCTSISGFTNCRRY